MEVLSWHKPISSSVLIIVENISGEGLLEFSSNICMTMYIQGVIHIEIYWFGQYPYFNHDVTLES